MMRKSVMGGGKGGTADPCADCGGKGKAGGCPTCHEAAPAKGKRRSVMGSAQADASGEGC